MTDPKAPASVRLKAAQTILNFATTPPPSLSSQIFDLVHNSAQSIPPSLETAEPVHNSAEPFRRMAAKVGRNDACPCGSGRKFKYCCLDKVGSTGA